MISFGWNAFGHSHPGKKRISELVSPTPSWELYDPTCGDNIEWERVSKAALLLYGYARKHEREIGSKVHPPEIVIHYKFNDDGNKAIDMGFQWQHWAMHEFKRQLALGSTGIYIEAHGVVGVDIYDLTTWVLPPTTK